MLESDRHRRLKVGLFTGAMLALSAFSVLLIGGKQGLFVRYVAYTTRFVQVAGLLPGAPVWLSGVVVGQVDDVVLPSDPAAGHIVVHFRVEARLAKRIRADSKVRIRTLGLLGDRYIEISPGSPTEPAIAVGAEVPSTEPADFTAMLSKSGDVMANIVSISSSLRGILERIERGEGILGELTMSPEKGHRTVELLGAFLEHADTILADVRNGKGTIGRLFSDDERGEQLFAELSGMVKAGRQVAESLAVDLKREDSMLAALLKDPAGRERLQGAVDSIGQAGVAVAAIGRDLQDGKGTLGRLLTDEEYSRAFLDDLARLSAALRSVADKLDHGQGSAASMINDPDLYRDLENVVRGVRESRVLRRVIENRRKAGERTSAAPTATPR
jgi:phospholipid/cholesterol/gamma-HCH transport system substrate-binding protein